MDIVNQISSELTPKKDFPKFKPRKYLGFSAAERAQLSEKIKPERTELNRRFSRLLKNYNFIDVQKLEATMTALLDSVCQSQS